MSRPGLTEAPCQGPGASLPSCLPQIGMEISSSECLTKVPVIETQGFFLGWEECHHCMRSVFSEKGG